MLCLRKKGKYPIKISPFILCQKLLRRQDILVKQFISTIYGIKLGLRKKKNQNQNHQLNKSIAYLKEQVKTKGKKK